VGRKPGEDDRHARQELGTPGERLQRPQEFRVPAAAEHALLLEERGSCGGIADHVTLHGGEELIGCRLRQGLQNGGQRVPAPGIGGIAEDRAHDAANEPVRIVELVSRRRTCRE
jgi:hypothetical protein